MGEAEGGEVKGGDVESWGGDVGGEADGGDPGGGPEGGPEERGAGGGGTDDFLSGESSTTFIAGNESLTSLAMAGGSVGKFPDVPPFVTRLDSPAFLDLLYACGGGGGGLGAAILGGGGLGPGGRGFVALGGETGAIVIPFGVSFLYWDLKDFIFLDFSFVSFLSPCGEREATSKKYVGYIWRRYDA